jgi:hypothetical protein
MRHAQVIEIGYERLSGKFPEKVCKVGLTHAKDSSRIMQMNWFCIMVF